MITLALTLIVAPMQDAEQVLKDIASAYQKLSTYSVTIEHYNSSGLFPGAYTQQLRWRMGGKFELKVTAPNPLDVQRPGSKAPDYYCDGKDVLTIRDGSRTSRPINKDPNISPGYEVSCGFVLTFLLESPNLAVILHPPIGSGMKWSLGQEVEWKGERAKKLIMTIERQGQSVLGTYYYVENPFRLIGMEFKAGNQEGWLRYREAKTNPDLPPKLGDPPSL